MIEWAYQFLKPDTTFIDVGAHIGSWTLMFAKKAQHVVSFEAQRGIYYQLCGNIAINNLVDNVVAHNIGLGSPEQSGTSLTISKYGVDYGSSTFHQTAKDKMLADNIKCVGTEEVSFRTLDSYDLKNVSLIKIDVEGFEINVLKGATKLLKECRPVIILESWTGKEYKDIRDELINYLTSCSYKTNPINGYTDYLLCTPI